MIIENTQQLDELLGLMRRAAVGAARAASGAVGGGYGAASRVRRAGRNIRKSARGFKRNVGQAYRSGIKGGLRTTTGRGLAPKRGSASFAINRAKRRVRVAGGDLSKTMRGRKTGYDVNIAKRVAARRTASNAAAPSAARRGRQAAQAYRKSPGSPTARAGVHTELQRMKTRAAADPAFKAKVQAAQKRVLAKRAATKAGAKPSVGTVKTHGFRTSRGTARRIPGTQRGGRPITNPRRLIASWNPTFNKLINEISPPGFEGTVKAMKKRHSDEIDNPWALAWYMKNQGFKSHKKKDGTNKK